MPVPMPCPADSKPSAARCASWSTPPTRRSPRPSSAPTAPASAWRAAFLYDGGIVAGPEGIITGGHASKTGRTVAIWYGEAVTTHALIAMFWQVIASDWVGGWSELRAGSRPGVTEFGPHPGDRVRVDSVPGLADIVLSSRLLQGVQPAAALACLMRRNMDCRIHKSGIVFACLQRKAGGWRVG